MITQETTPRETMQAAMGELGLTVESVFVPWSRSRNKAEKSPSLNWRVTVKCKGRDVLTTDYGAGSGHCPAYKASVKRLGGQNSLMRSEAIKWECENGKESFAMEGLNHISARPGTKPLMPDSCDVIHSLISDSDVINYDGFESWAREFGYDTDSRKGESIYRACLDIALKLRNAIGDAGMEKLREAGQDY